MVNRQISRGGTEVMLQGNKFIRIVVDGTQYNDIQMESWRLEKFISTCLPKLAKDEFASVYDEKLEK